MKFKGDVIELDVYNDAKEVVGYIAMTVDIYNQCVILTDRYSDVNMLTSKFANITNADLEVIKFFDKYAPAPFNILGPFLSLAKGYNFKGDDTLMKMTGILHMISRAISFTSYVSVPEAVRAEVKFTTNMLDYKSSWNDLMQTISLAEVNDETKLVLKDLFASMSAQVSLIVKEVLQDLSYNLLSIQNAKPSGFDPNYMNRPIPQQAPPKTENVSIYSMMEQQQQQQQNTVVNMQTVPQSASANVQQESAATVESETQTDRESEYEEEIDDGSANPMDYINNMLAEEMKRMEEEEKQKKKDEENRIVKVNIATEEAAKVNRSEEDEIMQIVSQFT